MIDPVAAHYSGGLADEIAESLWSAGKDRNELTAADIEKVFVPIAPLGHGSPGLSG